MLRRVATGRVLLISYVFPTFFLYFVTPFIIKDCQPGRRVPFFTIGFATENVAAGGCAVSTGVKGDGRAVAATAGAGAATGITADWTADLSAATATAATGDAAACIAAATGVGVATVG